MWHFFSAYLFYQGRHLLKPQLRFFDKNSVTLPILTCEWGKRTPAEAFYFVFSPEFCGVVIFNTSDMFTLTSGSSSGVAAGLISGPGGTVGGAGCRNT